MRAFSLLAVCLAAASSAFAQSPDVLEKSARAVLDRHCMACHGEAQMAGLDMRERETLLKGGKSGPAVVPGKADTSRLYRAASHAGELKMPPGAARIPKEELQALRDWINDEDGGARPNRNPSLRKSRSPSGLSSRFGIPNLRKLKTPSGRRRR